MSIVGPNIKRMRNGQGISREELGRRSGISMNAIYQLENEIQENPRLETMRKIAEGLGVSVTDLLEEPKAKAS